MIDVIDKKQMYDSVITGIENSSEGWICTVLGYIDVSDEFLMSILCLITHVLCVSVLKLLSGFFGTRSGFFCCKQVGNPEPSQSSLILYCCISVAYHWCLRPKLHICAACCSDSQMELCS